MKLQSVQPLGQKGYEIFYVLVFQKVNADTRDSILNVINMERQGETIDRDLVKGVVDIYIEIAGNNYTVYKQEFEDYFLPASEEFYQKEVPSVVRTESYHRLSSSL